jgi:Tol biopolymer transport system component
MIGRTIGQYTIIEELGRGGMGVVYKALDAKLNRNVALKFLPPHLSGSEADRARFLQEARAAATLSHPNVCAIHDIGEADGTTFIVMDLVEGKTLKEMADGLGLKQAVEIGMQVADGLAAAHEKGIVHRDVKPENIMVRKDGIVQIMDFGLAKLAGVSRLTREGSTVGTVGYMSPEQVQGLNVDHRSDIFSLGVLLYEMFVHRSPFSGVHETAVQYEIVNVDPPPMAAVNPQLDPGLDAIVLECLAKEPADRFQSAAEVAKELRRFKRESVRSRASRVAQAYTPARPEAAEQAPPPLAAVAPSRTAGSVLPWIVAGTCAGLAAVLGFLLLRTAETSTPAPPAVSSSIVLPDSIHHHCYGYFAGPAQLSPDGSAIVFVGIPPNGVARIYVRRLAVDAVVQLEGTEGAAYPFWSPDGRSVGYFAGGKLKRIDVSGGPPATVTSASNARGGSWAEDGTILFTPDFQTAVFRVAAGGGEAVPASVLDSARGEASHRYPSFLPDGRHFLYLARVASDAGEAEGDAVMLGSLDGAPPKVLLRSSSQAVFAAGRILFVRGSTLLGQPFDAATLSVTGEPERIHDGVLFDASYNLGAFSASRNGLLLFQPGGVEVGAQLLMGEPGGVLVPFGDRVEQGQARFSPDGTRIALYVYDLKTRRSNVWSYDIPTQTRQRETSLREGSFYPVFTPDGKEIYFTGGVRGGAIYRRRLGSTAEPEVAITTDGGNVLADFSPDGRLALVERQSPAQPARDLWLVEIGGDPKGRPFMATGADEGGARFSPDGSLICYQSDESGQPEVYVRSLLDTQGRASKVSAGGGATPLWGGSASVLYYVAPATGDITMVTLRSAGGGVEVTARKRLSRMPLFSESWDITRDGRRMVIGRGNDLQRLAPLTLKSGWDQPPDR